MTESTPLARSEPRARKEQNPRSPSTTSPFEQIGPEFYEELTLVNVLSATAKVEQGATGQRKDPHQLDQGKTAAGLLGQRLGVSGLVAGSIGHGEPGTIDHLNRTPPPETSDWDVSLHALTHMPVDALQNGTWEPCPSLTISTGIGRDLNLVSQRPPSLGFTHRIAAGGVGREHLSKKGPESHQWAEESLPAGATLLLGTEQRVGHQGTEELAQCRDGISLRKLTLELSASCTWSSPEEQWTKSGKKRCRGRHR